MTMTAIGATLRQGTHRLWRSHFARNVAIVTSGTAGAQAITMAFAPLITRLYGPEAFGLMGTFMAITAIVIPLAALTYPTAIVLPRSDRDALGLARLSVILSVAMAMLVAGLLMFGGDWLAATLGAESVASYLLLIPVFMLFGAWLQIVHQWLIRKKEFGVVARSAVAYSLIVNSAKSGIGWFHPVGAVLIVLATLGQALHAGLLLIGARRRYSRVTNGTDEGLPSASLRQLAYRHRDFPLYRAPQSFINAASKSMPVLILAAFFGPAAAGFYTLAKMVMGLPTILIGKAVNDVFYPRITEAAHNGENLPRYILQTTGVMLAIGMVPFGLVILFGPALFSFVFGNEWAVAGEYARWLSFWLLAAFISRPSIATIPVLSLQKQFLIYEIVSVAVRTLSLILGVLIFQSDVVAVALFSLSGLILIFLLIEWVRRSAYMSQTNLKHIKPKKLETSI
jgi:O-antigen/teichoic acid export membrane protein